MSEFGDRLKAARVEKKLTQVQLASKAGVSQPTLAIWEKGSTRISPTTLSKLEESLGLPSGELLRSLPKDHPARRVVPVIGVVAAGAPVDEPCEHELLDVGEEFLGCIAYKARGTSMVDRLIGDGDYLVVQPHHDKMPCEGDTVVAWLAGEHGHVVKVLGKRATLESPGWKHRLADEDVILGVLVGVIRRCLRKN